MANRGVPKGFKHKWKYTTSYWNEIKVSPRKWLFTFYQTKYRKGRKAKYGSGIPLRGRIHWKLNAHQYALKTSPNSYKLITKGSKRLVRYQKPKRKY